MNRYRGSSPVPGTLPAAKARKEALLRSAKVEAVKKQSSDLVTQQKDYDGALAAIDRAIAGLSPPDEGLIAWRRHILSCMKCYKLHEEVDRDLERGGSGRGPCGD